jgi:lysophospholipase L1-like esterase
MYKIRHIILIGTILLIACSPLKNYRDLPEVKFWEPEITKFENLDKTENYLSDAIMFAGSSSIRLWSTLAQDMAPYNVIQRGYGGAKLSDYAIYADRIFSPHPCKALVIFIANDIMGAKQDKTPEEVKKLFLSLLKTFRKSHPSSPVFWIEITPTSSRWKVWPQVIKANDLIRKECKNHRNTYFINTSSAFLNEKGLPKDELFRDDKLHLNADGYKVWTELIKDELNRVLNK